MEAVLLGKRVSQICDARAKSETKSQSKRERLVGDFYQCSVAWTDMAAEATGRYLILALRLYLSWRTRRPGAEFILASTKILKGTGYSREGKRRVLQQLEAAELIVIVGRGPGRVPRIQVVDPQLV
jgi:hypothetical protein